MCGVGDMGYLQEGHAQIWLLISTLSQLPHAFCLTAPYYSTLQQGSKPPPRPGSSFGGKGIYPVG